MKMTQLKCGLDQLYTKKELKFEDGITDDRVRYQRKVDENDEKINYFALSLYCSLLSLLLHCQNHHCYIFPSTTNHTMVKCEIIRAT
jgi:hypothetical protein